jgi:hypothetical protein
MRPVNTSKIDDEVYETKKSFIYSFKVCNTTYDFFKNWPNTALKFYVMTEKFKKSSSFIKE